MFPFHYECSGTVVATESALFDHLDRHDRLAGHMTRSSWMMAGASMQIGTDTLKGRALGSRIRIRGRVLGFALSVDEIVTVHEPPRRKIWATVDGVRLLVIGSYRMGFEIAPSETDGDSRQGIRSVLRVFIDYELPDSGLSRWLGKLLGSWYARWCTNQMLTDAVAAFAPARASHRAGQPIEGASAR
jgi:hypothetical protein